ncbi:MAG: LLM class flavin-dependent oxidoreductase [Phycisphaeraceae bacterium]|nr:LLM class flavin-dependent oxidoreductase [Phycisphaerales bacterium]MCB9860398.1 LLM class flavin-dependent oxidoreductase [Phycisphaeraceae bacterium]
MAQRPDRWPFPNSAYTSDAGQKLFRQCIDQLVYAEACGFDWVGVGEDHMTAYGLTPNPMLILSILAERTTCVKLAVLGAPLPLLNPLRVAEECAMIDVISNGRLVAGFIRGVPQNYAAYNIAPEESRQRFAEAHELILRAWQETTPFSWNSTYYNFPHVSIWPRPVQQPHPPIVYSANSETSAVFAAKSRAAIGAIHLYSLDAIDRVKSAIDAYRGQAARDGWEPDPEQFIVGFQTCVAETDELAFRKLEPALNYQYQILSGTFNAEKKALANKPEGYGYTPVEESPPTLGQRLDNHIVLCGSPSTVTRQIEYIKDTLGVGVISTHMQVGNMADADVRESMHLFGSHVAPAFRSDSKLHQDSVTTSYKPIAQSLGWHVQQTRHIHRSKWFDIVQDQLVLPSNEQREYTYIDHPGSVFMVPCTPEGQIVLIRSYRYTTDSYSWEIPAGGIGDHLELALEDVAKKELLEEIGAECTELIPLGSRFLGNGMAKHRAWCFIALGARPAQPTTDDETEHVVQIEVVDRDRAKQMAIDGIVDDGDSALALLLALDYIDRNQSLFSQDKK